MTQAQFGGFFPSNLDLSMVQGLPDDIQKRFAPPVEDKELMEKCGVSFFQAAHFLSYESEKAGYPKFESRDYVKVAISEVEVFVTDLPFTTDKFGNRVPHWKRRFWFERCRTIWDQYQRLSKGEVGTPLRYIPGADMALVATLETAGIKTAEQLVALKGDAITHVEGASALKNRAHAYLDHTAALEVKTQEAEELKRQLDEARKEAAEALTKFRELEQSKSADNTEHSAGRSEQGESEASDEPRRKQRAKRS